MRHKLCRSFHPWCPGVKTRCLYYVGAQISLAWSSWCKDYKFFLLRSWGISGRWGRTGASSQPPPEDSPRGNRSMAPPQASPYLLWPLSLVCHLLFWTVRYTWGLDRLQMTRDASAFLVDSTGTTTTENRIYTDAIETHDTRVIVGLLNHIESRPRYQRLGFVHVDPKFLSFHVSPPEDQLLLQFLQRFRDDDQVISIQVSPWTFRMELLGEGIQNRDEQ